MFHHLPPVITLETRAIEALCEGAALRAVSKFAQAMGMEERKLSEREAFEMFGEARIKRWVRDGRLTYTRLTDSERSKKQYKIIDIITLATEDRSRTKTAIHNE